MILLYNAVGNKVCCVEQIDNPYGRFEFEQMSSAELNDELLNHEINLESSRLYDRIHYLFTMKITYPKSIQLQEESDAVKTDESQSKKSAEKYDEIYADSSEWNQEANGYDDIQDDDYYCIAGSDNKVLLFLTHFKNPYNAILKGLSSISTGYGCDSWFEAFVNKVTHNQWHSDPNLLIIS